MTQEQPAIITVPPRDEFVLRRLKPRARKDYDSRAWQSDLYYAKGEFGQAPAAKDCKRRLRETPALATFPGARFIVKNAKQGGPLNPPPVGERKEIHVTKSNGKRATNGKRMHKSKKAAKRQKKASVR